MGSRTRRHQAWIHLDADAPVAVIAVVGRHNVHIQSPASGTLRHTQGTHPCTHRHVRSCSNNLHTTLEVVAVLQQGIDHIVDVGNHSHRIQHRIHHILLPPLGSHSLLGPRSSWGNVSVHDSCTRSGLGSKGGIGLNHRPIYHHHVQSKPLLQHCLHTRWRNPSTPLGVPDPEANGVYVFYDVSSRPRPRYRPRRPHQ